MRTGLLSRFAWLTLSFVVFLMKIVLATIFLTAIGAVSAIQLAQCTRSLRAAPNSRTGIVINPNMTCRFPTDEAVATFSLAK